MRALSHVIAKFLASTWNLELGYRGSFYWCCIERSLNWTRRYSEIWYHLAQFSQGTPNLEVQMFCRADNWTEAAILSKRLARFRWNYLYLSLFTDHIIIIMQTMFSFLSLAKLCCRPWVLRLNSSPGPPQSCHTCRRTAWDMLCIQCNWIMLQSQRMYPNFCHGLLLPLQQTVGRLHCSGIATLLTASNDAQFDTHFVHAPYDVSISDTFHRHNLLLRAVYSSTVSVMGFTSELVIYWNNENVSWLAVRNWFASNQIIFFYCESSITTRCLLWCPGIWFTVDCIQVHNVSCQK